VEQAGGLGPHRMADETVTLRDTSGAEHRASVAGDEVTVGAARVTISPARDGSLHVQGPASAMVWAVVSGGTRWVFADGHVFTFEIDRPAAGRRRGTGHQGPITAPMPAMVRTIAVAEGDAVTRGDVVIVLEAMKMELPVRAAADGVVRAVNCREGEMVQPGRELVEIE
jgi:biotin carboxyl carrier protein